MKIKADLHVHSHNSHDCRMSLEEIAASAKSKGIHCVCVCDHNTLDGYYEILKKCDEKGFIDGILFLPAIEYSTDAGHIIGLFMNNPATPTKDHALLIKYLRQDGFPVLAHPYAKNKDRTLIEKVIDLGVAVEVANSRVSKKANKLAAVNIRNVFTAGSDAHLPSEIGNTFVELETEELSFVGIRKALSLGNGTVYHTPSKRVYRGISQLYRQIDAGKWYRIPDRLAKTAILFIKDIFSFRKTVIMEGKKWQ